MNALANLLNRGAVIWRGSRLAEVSTPSIPTGFAQLDAELPGGGWPTAALTEILPQHEGIGELRILGPALAQLSRQGRWLAWIAPPHIPYAPALQAAGIDLSKLLLIKPNAPRETIWAIEQALRSKACGAILGWPDKITYPELRRLQLAAEGQDVLAVLFRTPQCAAETTPAALRISLSCNNGELAIRLLKRRGASAHAAIAVRPRPIVTPRSERQQNHVVDSTRFSAPAHRIFSSPVSAT